MNGNRGFASRVCVHTPTVPRAVLAAILLLTSGVRAFAAGDSTTKPTAAPFMGAYIHMDSLFKKGVDASAKHEAIRKALDRFKASGLRVAMPYATTTSGTANYASAIMPTRVTPESDMLAVLVTEAHKRGLEVWPVFCVAPAGDAHPGGILLKHPEWALLDKNGKEFGCLSPCNPQAREYMASVAKEIVSKYQTEGILLDYLRFPSQVTRPDPTSAVQFEKEYPDEKNADAATKKKHLQAFKEANLTELAKMISEEVRKTKPGVRIGLYTWGPQVAKSHNVAQAWPTWAAKGYVDMVSVSGYCYRSYNGPDYLKVFEDRMKEAVQLMKEARSPAELTLTLGVKTSHGHVNSAAEIDDYLRIARRVGIRGVAVFTWTYLEPYLDEVLKAGYLKRFAAPAEPKDE